MKFLALVGAAALASVSTTLAAQTVTLGQGKLRGTRDGGAEVFKNIPFAAPPVANLRWKPPQTPSSWNGVRDATAFGPACVQRSLSGGGGVFGVMMGDEGAYTTSEDCLNLNIRRPVGTKAGAKLPVMLWIYGGGFQFGRNSQRTYTGTALVKRGVILVTPNYRLGAFGFLAHPELSAESPHGSSGNYGALDVVAALQWVQKNIADFGGDPGNVTIFGESAGGGLVGMLSVSPLTQGLFAHSISQSGGFFGPVAPEKGARAGAADTSLASAERSGVTFLKNLDVASIAEARRLSAEQVFAATAPRPGAPPVLLRPNLDHFFLPKPTRELLTAPGFIARPALVGSNDDEGVLSVPTKISVARYTDAIKQAWGDFAGRLLAAYPATTDVGATHAARNIQRDGTFAWSAWTWGREQTGAKVYLYNFDHRPPFPKNPEYDIMAAPHAADLPYVFGTIDAPGIDWSADDRAISNAMIGYWTNFAKSGNPNGPGLPEWAAFESGQQQSMHFGQTAPASGTVSSLSNLALFDAYYESRRRPD